MRVVIVFAPLFLEWPKEIMRVLQREQPDIEIVGLTSSRLVHDSVVAETDLKFKQLDCLEDLERDWATGRLDIAKLEQYEKDWGSDFIRKLVISDRHVGAGYVTGGPVMASELRRYTKTTTGVQAFIFGMMNYMTDLFDKHEPDVVLAYFVAGAPGLALSGIAEQRGAKFYNFIDTRAGNRKVLDSSPVGRFDDVYALYKKVQKNPQLVDEYRDDAKAWLAAFREKRSVIPDYAVKAFSNYNKGLRPLNIAKNFARTVAKAVAYPFVRGKRPLRGERAWQEIRNSLYHPLNALYYLRDSFYTPAATCKDHPYIYYALHVEPEASTMVLSPYHTNQLAVIEALSKASPLSWKVVVKEHPIMVGKRPRGFYEKIKGMPGVEMVHPQESSMRLTDEAALTATITGTVAWEAILLQKPTLILGSSPFTDIGEGFVLCDDMAKLHEAIEKAVKTKPASDKSLINYLACIFHETFEVPFEMWSSPSRAVLDQNTELTDLIVQKILSVKKRKKAA